jgi:hypothetical protein
LNAIEIEGTLVEQRGRLTIRQRSGTQIGGRSAAFERSHDALTDHGLKYRPIPARGTGRYL